MTEIIKFHDAELLGIQEEEIVWIPIKPICDAMGARADDYIKAINKDEILGRVRELRPVHDASGRVQNMVCLPIHHVHGWLFGIDANKVKPEIRPRLLLFKQECYSVLYEHFFGNARQVRIDAEREQQLIRLEQEQNRIIRDAYAKRDEIRAEKQTILNRRAKMYRLPEPHPGAENQLANIRTEQKRKASMPELDFKAPKKLPTKDAYVD